MAAQAACRTCSPSAVNNALSAGGGAFVLHQTHELLDLARRCDDAGLPHISFKGPTLALLAYGNLAARRSNDLDFLFRIGDMERALTLLIRRGYQPVPPAPSRLSAEYLRRANHCRLIHRETGIQIEPHWRLLPVRFAPRLDLDGVWERCQSVILGGTALRTLGPEDLTLYLALHGYAHRWERIQWLEDLHRIVQRYPELDWNSVVSRASQGGVERALFAALELSCRMFSTEIPQEILRAARRDSRCVALADVGESAVRAGRNLGGRPRRELELITFRARGHSRWLDTVRFLAASLLEPTCWDLASVRLPPSLRLMYYAVRPPRLALVYVRMALAGTRRFAVRLSRTRVIRMASPHASPGLNPWSDPRR